MVADISHVAEAAKGTITRQENADDACCLFEQHEVNFVVCVKVSLLYSTMKRAVIDAALYHGVGGR